MGAGVRPARARSPSGRRGRTRRSWPPTPTRGRPTPTVADLLGYIPSPSANGFSVGPLRLHVYGFLIVCGVFAAVWLADRRWRARGGEPGTFSNIAVWAVPAGLIGARLYSVFTDYELYDHHPLTALQI